MFIQSASVPLDGVKQSHHWPAPPPISATWGADRDLPRPWPPLIGSPAQMTDNHGAQRGICIRVVYRCGLRSLLESFVFATKGEWGGLFYSSFTIFISVLSCLCASRPLFIIVCCFFFFILFLLRFFCLLNSKKDLATKEARNGFSWLVPQLGWVQRKKKLFFLNDMFVIH